MLPFVRVAAPALFLIIAPISIVAEPAPAPKAVKRDQWVFSLLPKSLQKNPQLDLTVVSEMTDAGRKLPPVTPSQPAYFETFSAGFHALGDQAGDTPFPEKDVTAVLLRSLATSGYLPAKRPEHPPTLLLIYTWGTHNLLREADPENPGLSGNAVARNLLDRAALVGGPKFAAELRKKFEELNDMAIASATPAPDPTGAVPEMTSALSMMSSDLMNPIERFKRENPKNEFLVDQATSDVYYVVASAYDYKSAATEHRVLLWRTRMTVAASGVSQEQTLPTLVLTAGPYFGKDMPETEIITKRAVREGTVEVGTPTVVPPAELKTDPAASTK